MKREIKLFDFVRVKGKGIKIVFRIYNDKVEVIGIGLSEDEDTIICKSSIYDRSEIERVDNSMINVAGPLWFVRDELTRGSFGRIVYK